MSSYRSYEVREFGMADEEYDARCIDNNLALHLDVYAVQIKSSVEKAGIYLWIFKNEQLVILKIENSYSLSIKII